MSMKRATENQILDATIGLLTIYADSFRDCAATLTDLQRASDDDSKRVAARIDAGLSEWGRSVAAALNPDGRPGSDA